MPRATADSVGVAPTERDTTAVAGPEGSCYLAGFGVDTGSRVGSSAVTEVADGRALEGDG